MPPMTDTIVIPPRDQCRIAADRREWRFQPRASPSRNPTRGGRASPSSGLPVARPDRRHASRPRQAWPAAGSARCLPRDWTAAASPSLAGSGSNAPVMTKIDTATGPAWPGATTISAIAFSPWIWTVAGHGRLRARRRAETHTWTASIRPPASDPEERMAAISACVCARHRVATHEIWSRGLAFAPFRYRAATRVDTLGGNAAESRPIRRLSTFTDRASSRPRTLQKTRKEMP